MSGKILNQMFGMSGGFFDFKVYKKGTGHFKFRDVKVWELLNRTYAKIKGEVLPERI